MYLVTKMLVVIDHFRPEMFEGTTFKFFNSKNKMASSLYNLITKPRAGFGLEFSDVDLTFAYPQIPKWNKITRAYQAPSKAALAPYFKKVQDYVQQTKPDLILTFGTMAACSLLVNDEISYSKATKLVNLNDIVKHTYPNGHIAYHAYYPSLMSSKYMSIMNQDKTIILTNQVKQFLKNGAEGLKPEYGEYQYLTKYEDVKKLFTEILPKQKLIACDFETNTLKTWLKGAKAIMFSCSWKAHQGISIPLDHKKAPNLWTPEQHQQIFKWIVDLVSNKQFKVFHNSLFDIRMMMDIMGLEHAQNVLDTMIFYYIGYSEEQEARKGLKFLSRKYLTLGDYEKDRDVYFENLKKSWYDTWYKQEEGRLAKEAEEKGIKPKAVTKSKYQPPRNELDGSDMNFEWLPLDIIAPYASADTDATIQLFHIFAKRIRKNDKWTDLCYRFYPRLIDTLCYITHTGFHFDTTKCQVDYKKFYNQLKDELIKEMYSEVPEIEEYESERFKRLEKRTRIRDIPKAKRTPEQQKFFEENTDIMGKDPKTGEPKYKFSPNSSKKVSYILYHMLGYTLPPEKDYLKPAPIKSKQLLSHPERITWEDYKADSKSALPYLVKQYGDKFPSILMRYAEVEKLISSFVDSYSEIAYDDLIHAQFSPTGTRTSRLSSSSPNLQQISKSVTNPNDPLYNYPIKGLFTSRFENGYLFNFDYKTLEVFLSALISNETGLIQSLLNGEDVHRRNASVAFKIPPEDVDANTRFKAKSVTFGY